MGQSRGQSMDQLVDQFFLWQVYNLRLHKSLGEDPVPEPEPEKEEEAEEGEGEKEAEEREMTGGWY